jgi:hypothetical protein
MYRRVGPGGAYYTYNMYMHIHTYMNMYASYVNMYSGGVGRGGAYDILSFSSANIIYMYVHDNAQRERERERDIHVPHHHFTDLYITHTC